MESTGQQIETRQAHNVDEMVNEVTTLLRLELWSARRTKERYDFTHGETVTRGSERAARACGTCKPVKAVLTRQAIKRANKLTERENGTTTGNDSSMAVSTHYALVQAPRLFLCE